MNHPSLPNIRKDWSIGTVLAASCSIVSLLSVLAGLIWGYAGVTYATQNIPDLQRQQSKNMLDIRQLQTQQANNDARYAEILTQLGRLNDKLDRLNGERR